MSADLADNSILELLRLQSDVLTELRSRGVVRTKNNPIGDFAEWLVVQALGLKLEGNSKSGYDAVAPNGDRIQIKARRITPENKSRLLSAIRNLDGQDFDYLVAVIFDAQYGLLDAVMVPHGIIGEYATFSSHTNSHRLVLQGTILTDARIKDVSRQIQGVMDTI